MDTGVVTIRIGKVRITANIWHDGPNSRHYLSKEHLGYPERLPKQCSAADYQAVRVLANQPNALDQFKVAVPMLDACDFGIKFLGITMPWAWNKYVENRSVNDRKYTKYSRKTTKKYFKDFLKRMNLPENLCPKF